MSVEAPRHAVVVGGGITGLACALRLQELAGLARADLVVTLLEAAPRLGGKLLTERVDGFVIDAAADVFLERKPYGVDLCRTLGVGHLLQHTAPRRSALKLEDGELVRAEVAAFADAGPLVTLRGGMQTLADAAVTALRTVHARTGVSVTSVDRSADGYLLHTAAGEHILADAVVVALPAPNAVRVLADVAPDVADVLGDVRYTTTSTVSVAYAAGDVPHALDGYGYWIPGAGPNEVSACTWTSSKIPGRAPAGHALLRGYVQGDAGVVSPTAARDVRAELRRTLGITAEPLLERTYHWPVAVPVYGPQHAERSAIVARLPHDSRGLAVAGPAFDGLGMPDCIRSGTAAADAVWSHVAGGVAA